jgi:error-prone DNA polymerase
LDKDSIRIGFQSVHGMAEADAKTLFEERAHRPFQSLGDFLARTQFKPSVLYRLALGDFFRPFGIEQRDALWEILAYQSFFAGHRKSQQLSLFKGQRVGSAHHLPFKKFSRYQTICADYKAYGLSTRGHPMEIVRLQLRNLPQITTAEARTYPHGRRIKLPGLSIVMQRPPTAKGTVFATLEDETGLLDLIIHKAVFERHHDTILDFCFLLITGDIQRDGLSISLVVKDIQPIRCLNIKTDDLDRMISEGVRG